MTLSIFFPQHPPPPPPSPALIQTPGVKLYTSSIFKGFLTPSLLPYFPLLCPPPPPHTHTHPPPHHHHHHNPSHRHQGLAYTSSICKGFLTPSLLPSSPLLCPVLKLLEVAAIVGRQSHSSFDREFLTSSAWDYAFRPVGHHQIHLSTCNENTYIHERMNGHKQNEQNVSPQSLGVWGLGFRFSFLGACPGLTLKMSMGTHPKMVRAVMHQP